MFCVSKPRVSSENTKGYETENFKEIDPKAGKHVEIDDVLCLI